MDHKSTDKMRAYVTDELPYDERLAYETHLATCQECAKRVKVLLSVSENFDQIWKTWTVKRHAKEFHVAHLRHALKQAPAMPDMRRRLTNWAENITNRIETALGISLDVSERVVRVAREGFEFLPGASFRQFTPAPVPLSITGREDRPAWIAVESQNPPWTKVTIDPAVRRLLVQSEIRTVPWPLVALVARDHAWAAVASFRVPEGEEFLLAEFEDIPSGEFVLLIEKIPDYEPESE